VRTNEGQVVSTREPDRYLIPAVDIYETDDGLVLHADMPGVDKKNLQIRVEGGVLTIRADIPESKKTPAYEEYRLHSYFRQFTLSDKVDQEKITAELKHGVLTLSVPKAEEAKPKMIEVKVE